MFEFLDRFLDGTLVSITKAGHYRPASEPPFKWRFAGGTIGARHFIVSFCKNNTLNAIL